MCVSCRALRVQGWWCVLNKVLKVLLVLRTDTLTGREKLVAESPAEAVKALAEVAEAPAEVAEALPGATEAPPEAAEALAEAQ